MNYGLYLAAGGVLSNMHRQDVISNNLANLTTVGFKPDNVYFQQRLPERIESGAMVDPKLLLERLGGSPMLEAGRVSTVQGMLDETGNDLDVAVEGEGYLVVGPPGAGSGQLRLTRDGRLSLNASGELVMASNGATVLDDQNRAIRIDRSARVDIDQHGDVTQNGETVATIRLSKPNDPDNLVKVGNNLLRLRTPGAGGLDRAGGRILQGTIESSAVDAIMTLNDLVKTAKAAMANIKMMQFNDHFMGQAINTMGRVA